MSTAPRTAGVIESAVAHRHAPSGASLYGGSTDHLRAVSSDHWSTGDVTVRDME